MCALCGVLGGAEHWTDAVARPGVFTRNTDAASRRRERLNRVAAANRVLAYYRMNLADWQGSAFVLSTATGKTEIVDNLSHLWAAAERLLSRPCDPLDEELIARLGTRVGSGGGRIPSGHPCSRLSRLGQDDIAAAAAVRADVLRHG